MCDCLTSIKNRFWAFTIGILVCQSTFLLAQESRELEPDDSKAPFSGRIVDTDGKPVTDAEVSLQGPVYLQTETDEQGKFWFLDAKVGGEYRLIIESKTCVGLTDFRKAPRIAIDPNHPTATEFKLPRACRIELTVVDEKGKPVQASVYYKPLTGERFGNARNSKTNAEGVALVGGLDPSLKKYNVVASSPVHAPARVIVSTEDPNVVQQHKLVMSEGKSLKGKAVCSDGEPPAGWSILALPSWWNLGIYPAGSKIEEDGTFELRHVGDDPCSVSISIPLGDGMSTSRNVLTDAKLLEMKQPIQVTLNYPSPKSQNYLTGTIRWIGKPLESGIHISGYSADLKMHTSHHIARGKTEFKIGPMPNGVYRIRPEHPEIEVMNLRKIKNLNDLDNVKIPNTEPLQLVLRVRGKPHVQGIVVDAETQKPVERFRFRVSKLRTLSGPNYVQDDNWKLSKDATGNFESEVIGPGIYTVSILADGYAIKASTQVNTDDQPDEVLRIELNRGLTLSGKVVDENGNAINGATVRALSQASGAMDRVLDQFVTMEGAAQTEDGQFTLQNLGSGFETIRIDHPDFAFKVLTKVAVAEKNEPIVIKLSKGATVRGTVYDAFGKPQASETLLFQDNYAYGGGSDREAGKYGQAITDKDGQYTIEHLPDAIVYVSRAEEWNSSGVIRQALQAEDGKVHTLDFGGTSKIEGQFILNDQPLVSTRLQLAGTDSVFGAMKMMATTDSDGRFKFYGAPAGHWTLYRAFGEDGSEWVKVREIDVVAGVNTQLDDIRQMSGRLTVECKSNAKSIPQNLQFDLRQYDSQHLFGRTAALLAPRESPDSPFIFENVTPGEYEIACYGLERYSIIQRVEISDAEVNSTVIFDIPVGLSTLTVKVQNEQQEPVPDTLVLWSEDERLVAYLAPEPGKEDIGTYTLTNLPEGRFSLRRGNMRKAPIVAKFDVTEKVKNEIFVTIPKNSESQLGLAELFVTDENGVFVPCQIKIKEPAGAKIDTRQSDVFRSFVGPIGEYTVQISHPGFETIDQKIAISKIDATGEQNMKTHVRLRPLANAGKQ